MVIYVYLSNGYDKLIKLKNETTELYEFSFSNSSGNIRTIRLLYYKLRIDDGTLYTSVCKYFSLRIILK